MQDTSVDYKLLLEVDRYGGTVTSEWLDGSIEQHPDILIPHPGRLTPSPRNRGISPRIVNRILQ